MTDNSTAVAVSGIAIGQTITAYQLFLPPLQEVRRADPAVNRAVVHDVYLGQAAAGAVSIGVGAMLASVTGSRFPVYTSVFIAFIIAASYHYALICRPAA
jgi:hypothetical protein